MRRGGVGAALELRDVISWAVSSHVESRLSLLLLPSSSRVAVRPLRRRAVGVGCRVRHVDRVVSPLVAARSRMCRGRCGLVACRCRAGVAARHADRCSVVGGRPDLGRRVQASSLLGVSVHVRHAEERKSEERKSYSAAVINVVTLSLSRSRLHALPWQAAWLTRRRVEGRSDLSLTLGVDELSLLLRPLWMALPNRRTLRLYGVDNVEDVAVDHDWRAWLVDLGAKQKREGVLFCVASRCRSRRIGDAANCNGRRMCRVAEGRCLRDGEAEERKKRAKGQAF